MRTSALTLAIVLGPLPQALAQDTKVTWDNAPAIARKLYLTEDEFRELLPERKRPDAGFCPVPCTHNINGKQPNGKPFVNGKWEVDKNTGKADHKYVPGNVGPGYKNPYWCHVTAVYRYAPPAERQPRPEIVDRPLCRFDMTVFASVNAPYNAQKIRDWRERDAKLHMEDVRNPRNPSYRYIYIPDLGLGLDRNDLFAVLSNGVESCSITCKLNNASLSLAVDIHINLERGAVSQRQALAIAREAATIIARKAMGANARLEKAKVSGEVGLLDVWIADQTGKTPEEDRRTNSVRLGKVFHIVSTYKLPSEYDSISIGYTLTPGLDAVAASRERCLRVGDDSPWWKPLSPSGYRALDSELIYSSPEKYHADQNLVKVRKTTGGVLTVTFVVDTSDPERPYLVGPGAWEFNLQMKGVKRGGPNESDREVEISNTRVSLKIEDDPAFTEKVLKPLTGKK